MSCGGTSSSCPHPDPPRPFSRASGTTTSQGPARSLQSSSMTSPSLRASWRTTTSSFPRPPPSSRRRTPPPSRETTFPQRRRRDGDDSGAGAAGYRTTGRRSAATRRWRTRRTGTTAPPATAATASARTTGRRRRRQGRRGAIDDASARHRLILCPDAWRFHATTTGCRRRSSVLHLGSGGVVLVVDVDVDQGGRRTIAR